MRVPNEPGDGTWGPFSELLRLQAEFQSRLAEETLRYLRRLQGAAAPAAPGTVLMPGTTVELSAVGVPGATIELKLEVENRQRVHCVVTPMLSSMVSASGVTWFPAAEPVPSSMLLAPEEVAKLEIKLPLPTNLPAGAYRGALMLQGFRDGALAVAINVIGAAPVKPSGNKPSRPSQKRVARAKRERTQARRQR